MSKAFDTLDHTILLSKLRFYGITGIALNLLESYLTNRKQYVDLDGIKSDTLLISTGVPQGSILGPLLFIIYINDFPRASDFFDFVIYADDTTLSSTLNIFPTQNDLNTLAINNELSKISTWLKVNRLSLNANKSKFMLFHNPQKKIEIPLLKIDDIEIKSVKEFDFLGLTLNNHMTWKNHTDKIISKIAEVTGILNRLKHILPLNVKITIYNCLILSHLNFGILAWGFESERLQKLQKKCIRVISISKYNAHTEPLFKKLKLLKVQDIFNIQQFKFYHKFVNNNLPEYFDQQFFSNTVNHNYNVRDRENLIIPFVRHVFAQKCIRYSIPKLINRTDRLIVDKCFSHSLHGFSIYVKKYFIQNYDELCRIQHCFICGQP